MTSAASAAPADHRADPSSVSYYVDEAFYASVLRDIAEWPNPKAPLDQASFYSVERFLELEARLIDSNRLADWLELLTPECLYWIPSVSGGGDPTRQVAIAFEDRRRLEDRIARLETGYAYSQIPKSITRHMVSNLALWQGESDSEIRATANFVIFETRVGLARTIPGWYGYVLRAENGHPGGPDTRWRIVRKQVNLLDPASGHRDLSFIL